MGQCQYQRPDGTHCGANAMTDAAFCFFHDPSTASEREAARRAGGKARAAVVLSAGTPDPSLRSAGDVVAFLSETIALVRRGELDPKVANSVGYLAGLLLKALDASELEARLAALERLLSQQREEGAFALAPPASAGLLTDHGSGDVA